MIFYKLVLLCNEIHTYNTEITVYRLSVKVIILSGRRRDSEKLNLFLRNAKYCDRLLLGNS